MINVLIRIDQTASNDFMGKLFRCANVYVAPYKAEGFNLPVLESLASGTPVIIPRGGSTDDFTKPSFARYIQSNVVDIIDPLSKDILRSLNVSQDSLENEMKFVLEDYEKKKKWLKKASKKASKWAEKNYKWSKITQSLLDYVVNTQGLCLPKIKDNNNNNKSEL